MGSKLQEVCEPFVTMTMISVRWINFDLRHVVGHALSSKPIPPKKCIGNYNYYN